MPELSMGVVLTRDLLGLGDLAINDHLNYYIGPQFLGSMVSWNRQQATSPFIDGAVTTYRTRSQVTEQVLVEVLGDSAAELHTNLAALVAAVCQDAYRLNVSVDGQSWAYACEAADYQVAWAGPRLVARQVQVSLGIPRSPVPISGGF